VDAAAEIVPQELPSVAVPPDTPVSPPAASVEGTLTDEESPVTRPLQADADRVFAEEAAPSPPPRSPQISQPKKGRAVAVKGAILISQDGHAVQYRKKCCQCGHEDASKNRMPIRHGVTRASFFCPKCRKLSPVEIQGMK